MTLPLESTAIYFSEEILGVPLYPWQDQAISWFDNCPIERVKGSLCTPNGAGKSERVVATLTLSWLSRFKQGKVVITSKSSLQLETQIQPAIHKHASKFEGWKFVDKRIETPTGGLGILFVTDEFFRAEGHHPVGDLLNGPLLLIVDEAKGVPEEIFQALDRCTYQALLYVSSPGAMVGRFYESQMVPDLGFKRLRISLQDCPHISKDRIADILKTYGPDSPFTRSTLYGEFMEADSELRFNPVGLKRLTDMAADYERIWRAETRTMPGKSVIGDLVDQSKGPVWTPNVDTGWCWICEHPEPGLEYIGFGDPMTGEQSEGSKNRDSHAMGVMRKAYRDAHGTLHDDEIVAVLHATNGVRWDNDIAAERLDLLLRYFGDCCVIVEANNAGVEVMRLLKMAGRNLWLREKRDDRQPGKKLRVMGFQTNSATKSLWIGALARAIREETISCRYPMACSHFSTFILTEDGSGQAQPNCHDDFVTGTGLALFARDAATKYPLPRTTQLPRQRTVGAWS